MMVIQDNENAPPPPPSPPSGDPPAEENALGGGIRSLLSRYQAKRQKQKQKQKQKGRTSAADADKHGGGHDLAYEIEVVRSDSGTGTGGGGNAARSSAAAGHNASRKKHQKKKHQKKRAGDRPATIITTPVLLRQDSDDAVLSAVDDDDGAADDGAGKSTYEMIDPKQNKRRLVCAGGGRRCGVVVFLFVLVAAAAVLLALYFTGLLTGDGRGTVADDFDGAAVREFSGPTLSPTPAAPTSTPTSAPTFPPNPPRDYEPDRCDSAEADISAPRHLYPTENAVVSRIAYGSCFKPEEQISSVLWEDVRNFQPELFIWLGDNVYNDGRDIDAKRRAYNDGREDPYYSLYGPIAEPRIPVTGTWDDNDFGEGEGQGNDYICLASSQAEFVHHMSVPETDPRHPAQGENQRFGVYGSHMFARPSPDADGNFNGIHVINLDARSHRSPTRKSRGLPCEGGLSTMLGDEQWGWLEQELMTKKSTIKVIASGTQILPPTTKERTPTELCAYDGPGGTFDAANEALGEGTDFAGTRYESWGEVPQERARLLRLVQKSINAGMAKRVIFLSGEQHWGELMAMRIPEDAENGGGAAQVVYEVTASGIDQNWVEDVFNSHRVRVRTADSRGDGFYDKECNFPFVYEGVTYNDCADVFNTGIPVCATQTAFDNSVVGGAWGTCLPAEQELVPRDRQRYSLENKCADNYHFTCSAQANFGTMVVDWNAGTIMLSIRTPHHNSPMASEITVDI